jgi:beta-N-acetylhexosaminidase
MRGMTLEELVGQQLIVGIPGMELTPEWAAHLRRLRVGGVIPFARNWESPTQFRSLIRAVESCAGHGVLVMVDHEGGRWVRFSSDVTRFPAAAEMATRGEEAVHRQGATEAEDLRALGIHVNLAPCVDVLSEGSDPVIGPRSYGSDPEFVSRLATARITGLQEQGVSACAKHFPGLGAVPKDPHHHLPTVELDEGAMRRVHLPPFRAAIAAGVRTVMSSHVGYPMLDATGVPATWSRRLIHQLLREELRFDGVTLTDDMEMGALRELGTMGQAAVRAVAAGHDALLVCATQALQQEAFEALCAAYRQGALPEKALHQSIQRIAALRQAHGLASA